MCSQSNRFLETNKFSFFVTKRRYLLIQSFLMNCIYELFKNFLICWKPWKKRNKDIMIWCTNISHNFTIVTYFLMDYYFLFLNCKFKLNSNLTSILLGISRGIQFYYSINFDFCAQIFLLKTINHLFWIALKAMICWLKS
jgi:hypothetical protein